MNLPIQINILVDGDRMALFQRFVGICICAGLVGYLLLGAYESRFSTKWSDFAANSLCFSPNQTADIYEGGKLGIHYDGNTRQISTWRPYKIIQNTTPQGLVLYCSKEIFPTVCQCQNISKNLCWTGVPEWQIDKPADGLSIVLGE